MTNQPTPRYDPATVELALVTLAVLGGSRKDARKLLKEKYQLEIAENTLSNWASGTHHERYLEICEEQKAVTQKVMAQKAVEIAQEAADGATLLVRETIAQKDEIPARDLASGARNLAQVHATMTDKALLLRGQPTEITRLENLDQVVDVLAGLGVVPNGEITDAEVVEESSGDQATLPAA